VQLLLDIAAAAERVAATDAPASVAEAEQIATEVGASQPVAVATALSDKEMYYGARTQTALSRALTSALQNTEPATPDWNALAHGLVALNADSGADTIRDAITLRLVNAAAEEPTPASDQDAREMFERLLLGEHAGRATEVLRSETVAALLERVGATLRSNLITALDRDFDDALSTALRYLVDSWRALSPTERHALRESIVGWLQKQPDSANEIFDAINPFAVTLQDRRPVVRAFLAAARQGTSPESRAQGLAAAFVTAGKSKPLTQLCADALAQLEASTDDRERRVAELARAELGDQLSAS